MTYQNERRKAGKHDAECNKIIMYNCKDHIDPRKGLNPLLERSKIIYKGMKTLKVITLHTSKQQTLNPASICPQVLFGSYILTSNKELLEAQPRGAECIGYPEQSFQTVSLLPNIID